MATQENKKKSIISFGDLLAFFLPFLCATVYNNVNKSLMGGATKMTYMCSTASVDYQTLIKRYLK